MNDLLMNVLLVFIFGLLGAVMSKGHARTLFWSSGAVLAVLAVFSILRLPIPFGYESSTVLICVFSLAVAGVADLLFQGLITRWRS